MTIFDRTASDTKSPHIHVSLAYMSAATADQPPFVWYQSLVLPVGTTIMEALEHSGWLERAELIDFCRWCTDARQQASINPKAWYVGIYSQKQLLSYVLQDQDRIEIYRPLTIDPMSKRRHKAGTKVYKHKPAKIV